MADSLGRIEVLQLIVITHLVPPVGPESVYPSSWLPSTVASHKRIAMLSLQDKGGILSVPYRRQQQLVMFLRSWNDIQKVHAGEEIFTDTQWLSLTLRMG